MSEIMKITNERETQKNKAKQNNELKYVAVECRCLKI